MKTIVWVRLEIDVRPGAEDPFKAVDTVLDAGVLQDEVNGIDVGLKVISALTLATPAEVVTQQKESCDDECCDECGDAFAETGPAAQSLAQPGTCVDCYTNGDDDDEVTP